MSTLIEVLICIRALRNDFIFMFLRCKLVLEMVYMCDTMAFRLKHKNSSSQELRVFFFFLIRKN